MRRGANTPGPKRFIKQGNAISVKSLFPRRDDVTLANTFGPPRRGWAEVEDALERASAAFKKGTAR